MASQSILKSSGPQLTSLSTSIEPVPKHIFNIKVPSINTLINRSSNIVSGLIGFAGTFWDSKKLEKQMPEDYEKEQSESSSIIYEESPDVIILSRHKVHGRKERFSREHAINLKKLRIDRFSEHIPRKRMQLQIEDDVQPQITTLRESIIEQRKRTESCYPRIQNQKRSHIEILAPTLQSVDSRDDMFMNKVSFSRQNDYSNVSHYEKDIEKIHRKISADVNEAMGDSEFALNSYDVKYEDNENGVDRSQTGVGGSSHNYQIKDVESSYRAKVEKIIRSEDLYELEKKNSNRYSDKSLNREMEDIKSSVEVDDNGVKDEVLHTINNVESEENEPQILYSSVNASQLRSIDSVNVSIDGKIFRYFDKTQLCTIPVLTFLEYLERLRTIEVTIQETWYPARLIHKLCCFKPRKLKKKDEEDLKKIIALSMIDFEYDNELHLILLLGTYTSVTGENDWPGTENEWLNMGFASTDMQKELQTGGVIGLLFTFYLSTHFPNFLKEMVEVSKYYSFDVFDICKHFALDTIDVLRARLLHCFFNEKDEAIDIAFLFYAGLIMHWFSVVVKNKDFNEAHKNVMKRARAKPGEFVSKATNMLAQN